jgi:hypothetical protein
MPIEDFLGRQSAPVLRAPRLMGAHRPRTRGAVAFGERAVLKLMYAALIRASETWRRVVISEFELKQLEQLREHFNCRHAERTAPAVKRVGRALNTASPPKA